ncbi:MAG: NGG1 interacting factor [Paramarteilia canceri]
MTSKRTVGDTLTKLGSLFNSSLAEKWDNVGVLISPNDSNEQIQTGILLTIDLTQNVLKEAINKKKNLIISYHPAIFSSLGTSLTYENPNQKCILDCIKNGITLFSPHTILDNTLDGMNDTFSESISPPRSLSIPFNKNLDNESEITITFSNNSNDLLPINYKFSSSNELMQLILSKIKLENCYFKSCSQKIYFGSSGPLVTLFSEPISLNDLISKIKKLCKVNYCQISAKNGPIDGNKLVKSMAICVGKGFSALKKFSSYQIDVFFTGEILHHEFLEIDRNENSPIVVSVGHWNSEHFYLDILRNKLIKDLKLTEDEISVSENDNSPFYTL